MNNGQGALNGIPDRNGEIPRFTKSLWERVSLP